MNHTQKVFVGAKGGVGTTTIATAFSVLIARTGAQVNLVGNVDDILCVLGVSVPDAECPIVRYGDGEIRLSSTPLPDFDGAQVVDAGTLIPFSADAVDVVLVTDNSYPALRRAVARQGQFRDVIVVMDGTRALTLRDVNDALGVDALELRRSADVDRAIDAGLFLLRFPRNLTPVHALMSLAMERTSRSSGGSA